MGQHVEELNLPAIVKVESGMGTLGDLERRYVMLTHIDYSVPTHAHYGICYDINGKKHEIATEHLKL